MHVNILFFGQLKDITGSGNLVMEDITDTETLVTALQSKYPRIAGSRYVLAVDKQIIQKNTALSHESTVALMPAFSGG
jgi:molybdopterin synthase sulfur carrier subunit